MMLFLLKHKNAYSNLDFFEISPRFFEKIRNFLENMSKISLTQPGILIEHVWIVWQIEPSKQYIF
jgi:hypothetical protein